MNVNSEPNGQLHGYAVGLTHVGRVRDENQDTYFFDEDIGVFAVMDGAGGLERGALASSLVRESLNDIGNPVSAEDLLQKFEGSVIAAKDKIDQAAREDGEGHMGTTIAALLTYGGDFACVWAGDSRVYRSRAGLLEQLTTDHTEVQDLLDRKLLSAEEARGYARRHVITRAIGSGLDLELELVSGKLLPGDRFLLCSDGLTGHLDDAVIGSLLGTGAANLSAESLLNGALDGGGLDNVTVVVVDIGQKTRMNGEMT